MTDFSNPNNPSQFSGKLNPDLANAKSKFSAKKSDESAPQSNGKPDIAPQAPMAKGAGKPSLPADAMLKNMENHALAWITTGQNPELNPTVARIVQEVMYNLPSQEAVMTVYRNALTKVSEEFGWNEEDQKTQGLAEEVAADLLIGRPVVKITQ